MGLRHSNPHSRAHRMCPRLRTMSTSITCFQGLRRSQSLSKPPTAGSTSSPLKRTLPLKLAAYSPTQSTSTNETGGTPHLCPSNDPELFGKTAPPKHPIPPSVPRQAPGESHT